MFVCELCGERSDQAKSCTRDGTMLVATDDPFLGSEVGRYRLVKLLGRGGMGRVYSAVQPDLGSRVAIKVLSDEAMERPELVERFFNEARAVNLIRHEGIVNVIDLMKLPTGRPAIVMELVDGRTLREIVRAGPVPLGGIVQVMIEVLQALAAAHAIGIVHRDLKPDNILITASGRGKVLDFGVAKLATNLQGDAHPTKTGAILGTPHYMSPEQIGGGTVDARADVYAAGIVLYEAVTGHLPFEGLGAFDLMRAHLEQLPPSPRHLRPDLPLALEQVIMCALAKQRGERFTTASAMANALHEAAATLSADQWRALSVDARMFPRSFTPPAPIERQMTAPTGPMPGHTPQTQAGHTPQTQHDHTPQTQAGHTPQTQHGRPGDMPTPATYRDRPSVPPSQPELAPLLEPTPTPIAPPRRRRIPIAAAFGAAAVGAGIAAIVMIATRDDHSRSSPVGDSGSASDPSPIATTADAGVPPIVVATTSPLDAGTPARTVPRPITSPLTAGGRGVGADTVMVQFPGDPHHFDPIHFLVTADALAGKLITNPQLMMMSYGPAFPDGHVDLGVKLGANTRLYVYMTKTPEATRNPDGLLCQVVVAIQDNMVIAASKREPSCKPRSATPRRCSLVDAWERSIGKTTWTTRGALVTWTSSGWEFDGAQTGEVGGRKIHGDDSCGQQTVVAAAPGTHPGPDNHSFYLDYAGDKSRFDGIAYLPTALSLARKIEPDAELTEIELRPVASTGFAMVEGAPGESPVFSFHFLSAKRAAEPAHDVRRHDDGRLLHLFSCEVFVQLENKGTMVTVKTVEGGDCNRKVQHAPRCSAQKIWAKGIARGVKPDSWGWLHYEYGRWEFSGEIGDDRKSFEFPDDC